MRVKDNNKKVGFFWFPENSNKEQRTKDKIHGAIHIKDGGEVNLEVSSPIPLNLNDKIPRIVGIVEQFDHVTLDNCYLNDWRISPEISVYIFIVDTLFTGIQYQTGQEIKFNSFSFYIDGLHQWILHTGIQRKPHKKSKNFTIQYKTPDSIICKISSNIDLSFSRTWRFVPSEKNIANLRTSINEKTQCKLTVSEALPLKDFTLIVQKINSFLCFVMDAIVCISDVSATADNIENMEQLKNVNIYYKSHLFVKNNLKHIRPLFHFKLIKDNIELILKNWIDIYNKSNPALQLYLSTQTREHSFIETRFLTLIQSIEAYHRGIFGAKNIKLKQRLKEIIEPLKKRIIFDHSEKLIEDILNTRNYLTHYNPQKQIKAMHGEELFHLCLKIEGILQLTLLEKIGLSEQQMKKVFVITNNYRNKLKQKIDLLRAINKQ